MLKSKIKKSKRGVIKMAAIKIKENIYSVGVLNPNMHIFDVIIKSDYGTSYNAYLIKSEKNVLIETVHPRFCDEYFENIASVIDIGKIDYVIMNHCEPDHSGSLARLIELAPQIQVLASQAGSIYLKSITNKPDLRIRAVKDGETLDIGGGKVLRFLSAPFLHWPDSMFTWLESDKVVFTCDFLGTHYCEPRMFDSRVIYKNKYENAFQGYYNAIFGPFKPYVLKGLEKLSPLDADFVCTSHGPVLTKGGFLEEAKVRYFQWSTPAPREKTYIPLFYCSAYGNTAQLAVEISKGISSVLHEAKVEAFDINENDIGQLELKINESDAFMLGTPTINRDAVAPVWRLASSIDAVNAKGRRCAVFGSYGWSGEGVPMVSDRLRSLKLDVFEEGFTCRFVPSDEEAAAAFEFGKRFALNLK
jgi:flavorubredoxin